MGKLLLQKNPKENISLSAFPLFSPWAASSPAGRAPRLKTGPPNGVLLFARVVLVERLAFSLDKWQQMQGEQHQRMGLESLSSSLQWLISSCCRRMMLFCFSRMVQDFLRSFLSLPITASFLPSSLCSFLTSDFDADSLSLQILFDRSFFSMDSFIVFTSLLSLATSCPLLDFSEVSRLFLLSFDSTFDLLLPFTPTLHLDCDFSFFMIFPGRFEVLVFYLSGWRGSLSKVRQQAWPSWILYGLISWNSVRRLSVRICWTLFSRDSSLNCRVSSYLETPSSRDSSRLVSLPERCFCEVMEKTSESALSLCVGGEESHSMLLLYLESRLTGFIILSITISIINHSILIWLQSKQTTIIVYSSMHIYNSLTPWILS